MTKARGDQPDKSADLSQAARAVVRDAGDPRIDAHLAALGLGPDPAPAVVEPRRVAPAESADTPELAGLRAEVAQLTTALATARRQARWLATALIAVLAGSTLAILLLLGRPG